MLQHTQHVLLSDCSSGALLPPLLSVAMPNLPELYYHTTDYMKIGTGRLQRMFLIISSAFLQIRQIILCNISFIFFNIFLPQIV